MLLVSFSLVVSLMAYAPASSRCGHHAVERLLGDLFCDAELIGEGGMGICFKCVDGSGASKAVKVSKDPTADAMEYEFNILDELRHPNITRVYRYLAIGDARGYEMDFMANGDLHTTIIRRGRCPGRLTHTELACWFNGVLSGLSYMHAMHILHRDVKPTNILFDKGWRAILGDLGLAVRVTPLMDRAPRTYCGTPGFMAPEVVAQEAYGTPADVWSMNRVLHSCLTGDPSGFTICDIDKDVHLLQRAWIGVLLQHSGCFIPSERARADQLCKLIGTSREGDVGVAPLDAHGTSQRMRADGRGSLLRKGRVAERHAKRNKRAASVDVEAGRVYGRARNAYRRIRRKATPRGIQEGSRETLVCHC